MKKTDIIISILTGELIAFLAFKMLVGLANTLPIFAGIASIKFLPVILAIVFPILTILGLWISWLLGKKFLFIFQLAKYALIGIFATVVDLGIFNIIWKPNSTANVFRLAKGTSFIFATLSKYMGDKFWAFEKMEKQGMGKELAQFFLVTLVGLGINVGVAQSANAMIGSKLAIDETLMANLAAIVAAVAAAFWNFVAYKMIVFKK